MRAAWAWGPCIAAVGHLRPVISIDAYFLSGRYKGKLLIVTGYDAENQLIPLAFGLVENEDFENWGWFMKWVREFVIGRNRYMCVVSDRHKGIKKVFIQDDLGWCEEKGECAHHYCSQHVFENFGKHTKDKVAFTFFKVMVKKKKNTRLQEGLDAIGRRNPAWLAYLDTCGKYNENDEKELPKPWKVYQAMDDGSRWEIMTSNGSESLNHVFQTSCRLPVAAIIDETFYKCVSWFEKRRETAVQLQAAGQFFSTRVHKKLDKHIEKTKKMSTLPFGHNEFMVTSHGEKINFDMENGRWVHTSSDCRYKVILKNDHEVECTCQKPRMGGIPCVHVMAVCRLRNLNPNDFVNYYYNIQTLIDTWSGEFHVYDNQCDWPVHEGDPLVPEHRLVKLGRRRHNRIQMWMDVLEGRRMGHRTSRETLERNGRRRRDARGNTQ
ncbi:uncharacterized protein LOC144553210 [Carex rostrata]